MRHLIFFICLLVFFSLAFSAKPSYAAQACSYKSQSCPSGQYCGDNGIRAGALCNKHSSSCICTNQLGNNASCESDNQCSNNVKCLNPNGQDCSVAGLPCYCGGNAPTPTPTPSSCTANGTKCPGGSYCAYFDGSTCQNGYTGCMCQPTKSNGSTCLNNEACSSNYCVDQTNGNVCFGQSTCKCQAPTGNGKTCTSNDQCDTTTSYCKGVNSLGACPQGKTCTCSPKQTSGACFDNTSCATGFYCKDSANISQCNPGTSTSCVCTKLQGVGGPCQGLSDCTNTKAYCAAQNGNLCGTSDKNCACKALVPDGGTCYDNVQCSSGNCQGADPITNKNGTCVAGKTSGSCKQQQECATGYRCSSLDPGDTGFDCSPQDKSCVCGLNGTVPSSPPSSAPSSNPPPPSPPCAKWNTVTAHCDLFATDFGLIGTSITDFITQVFTALLGMSGGIALLLIIRAGYRITASQGKPEAIQQGREELIAAIVGIMFLIFSFVILEVVGVDILKIPGLQH